MPTPPPPLIVKDITATPNFALSTTDPNQALTLPGFPTQIFDLTNPAKYVDPSNPTKATLRPIALGYPVDPPTPKTFKVALKLTLDFTAPEEWLAIPTSKCVVSARLPTDPLKPIFQSDEVPVSKLKGTWTVDSVNVPFPASMLSDGGKLPFKWAGAFIWVVGVVDNPVLVSLPTVLPTVLELYFTNVSAPHGHRGTFGNPILAKTPEFNSIYPLSLLRQFWPSVADIPGTEPARQEVLNEVHLQSIVKILWDLGNPHTGSKPQFDSTKGKSSYGIGALGGTFDLVAWETMEYPLCNTFDLCGVLHLACSLLLNQFEGEVVRPQWVLHDAYEFINPGQLYGFSDAPANPCNNPFWQAFLSRPATTPMIDAASQDRTFFLRHTWMEVSMYDPDGVGPYQGVLDASFVPTGETSAQFDTGLRDREQYLLNRLDKTRNENQISETSPGQYQVATSGDQFYTTSDRGYMVGVISTTMCYPIVPFLQGDDVDVGIPNVYMPVALKNEINSLLILGDCKARGSRNIIVDAPIDANSLLTALKPLDSTASVTTTTRSVFHIVNTFNTSFKFKAGEWDLTLESYPTYRAAKARLVNYLTTFSIGPLSQYVKAAPKTNQPLGHICLWIDTEVLIVYGNLFMKITLQSPAVLNDAFWAIISGLFKYIKTSTTGTVKEFNPVEELGPDKTIAVKSGDTVPIAFELQSNETAGTMALIGHGEEDTGEIYLWQMKPGDASGKFSFVVSGLGEETVILTAGDPTRGLVRSVAYTVSCSD